MTQFAHAVMQLGLMITAKGLQWVLLTPLIVAMLFSPNLYTLATAGTTDLLCAPPYTRPCLGAPHAMAAGVDRPAGDRHRRAQGYTLEQ